MNGIYALSGAFLSLMLLIQPAAAQNDLALCKLRAQHVITDDVAYRAGVDVRGNSVVPADLNVPPPLTPDIIRIPVTVDLAERLALTAAGLEMNADMGMVEIHRNGRVTYNGEDFSEKTAVICNDPENIPAVAPATTGGEKPLQVPAAVPVQSVEPVSTEPEAIGMPQQDENKDEIIWGQGH